MQFKLQRIPERLHFLAAGRARVVGNEGALLVGVKKSVQKSQKLVNYCKRRKDVTYLEQGRQISTQSTRSKSLSWHFLR